MVPGAFNPLQPQVPATTGGPVEPRSGDIGHETGRNLEQDAQRFDQALSGDSKQAETGDASSEGRSSGQTEGESSPGDALLAGMFGLAQSQAPSSTSPMDLLRPVYQEKPPDPSMASKLSDLASQVADRLLVTDPSSSTDMEVRILVKQDIMPDTEIRLTREGGELKIQIVTKSQEISNLLGPQQAALQALLQERLPREIVKVEVEQAEADTPEDESDRGSRNKRSVWEEQQEQKES